MAATEEKRKATDAYMVVSSSFIPTVLHPPAIALTHMLSSRISKILHRFHFPYRPPARSRCHILFPDCDHDDSIPLGADWNIMSASIPTSEIFFSAASISAESSLPYQQLFMPSRSSSGIHAISQQTTGPKCVFHR